MDTQTESDILERLFGHLDGRAEVLDDGGSENRWPVEQYLDERRFEREMAMIRRQPLPVAHVSQLRDPGDFVTDTICGVPLLLTRSESGEAKAFLNVCRHRGAQLLTEPCGGGLKSIVCPYHAWTYSCAGELTHVPDRKRSFPSLNPKQRGLVELPAAERLGLVWVTLDARAGDPSAPDVDAFLGELAPDLEAYGMERHELYRQDSWTTRFNWKCGVESFLENYHFAVLHRDTAGPIFVHNLGLCDQLGVHFRAIAPKKAIHDLRELDEPEQTLVGNATIMYVLFPFSCLFVEKDHFNLIQLIPETVGTCRVKTTHLVQRKSRYLEKYWDANIELYLSAVREDLDICESMQRGFASGANDAVSFGRNETGCHLYRRCVDEVLGTSSNGSLNGSANGSSVP
jgi:nitrite reductase/ring-hydroxylating ferredoxin subunit